MSIRGVMVIVAACVIGCAVGARTAPSEEPETKGEKPPAKDEKGEPFKLPSDAAGKLLSSALTPVQRPGRLDNPTRPAPPPAPPPALAGLDPTLPEMPAPTPKMGPAVKRVLRPRVVVPAPVDEGFGEPLLPGREAFGTLGKTREESEHPVIPPPLPYLAERPTDRVPLDDPTAEASGESVLTGVMPERAKPVPYVRTNVPEPFEFRVPLTLPRPPEPTTPSR